MHLCAPLAALQVGLGSVSDYVTKNASCNVVSVGAHRAGCLPLGPKAICFLELPVEVQRKECRERETEVKV